MQTRSRSRTGNTPVRSAPVPSTRSRSKSVDKKAKPRPILLLDPTRLPVVLWPPNLVGYARVALLVMGMCAEDRTGTHAIRCLLLSMALDFIDGPMARKFGMCSQFGDILDHVTDHVSMFWFIHITTPPLGEPCPEIGPVLGLTPNLMFAWMKLNWVINLLHFLGTLSYLACFGCYFKHGRGNLVSRSFEANNYWNLQSILWSVNSWVLPLIKMSYKSSHQIHVYQTTELLFIGDVFGAVATITYTIAVWWT